MASSSRDTKRVDINDEDIQNASHPSDHKGGGILEINTTRDITASEHDLKFWDAVQQYPQAVLWAMFFCIAVIMAGFDAQLITSFYALPAFQQRFGYLYDGSYTISAPWQTGLGSKQNSLPFFSNTILILNM